MCVCVRVLEGLLDTTTNNNNFTASYLKKPLIATPTPSTAKVNALSDINKKKVIIGKQISCAKLISSSETIFYKILKKNIEQTLVNNRFSYYIVDE